MERELALATLTLAVCGPTVFVCGSLLPPAVFRRDARDFESRSARLVWWPALVATVPLGVVLGWGLQEPDITTESPGLVVYSTACVIGALWLRALVRAAQSWLWARGPARGARTVGFVRPRVIVAPELAACLEPAELAAAYAHEDAHARHRDPLRVWLAQLVTDLQWPLPRAKARLEQWRHALEMARDDEARDGGIPGEDLASAIIKATGLVVERRRAEAALTHGPRLAERVAQLLVPQVARVAPEPCPRSIAPIAVLATIVTVAIVLGIAFGETAFRLLPGARP